MSDSDTERETIYSDGEEYDGSSEKDVGSDEESEQKADGEDDAESIGSLASDDELDEEDESEVATKTKKNKKPEFKFDLEEDDLSDVSGEEGYEEGDLTDEESDDEDYLQKFDKDVVNSYIENFHPESKAHNYDEVKALSNIVRDKNNIIVDELHKTLPFMTKYEKTRVLGLRAKQINSGAEPFIKVPPQIIDGYLIACMELEQKKIPFIIKRPLPNGGCEYWKVKDLDLF